MNNENRILKESSLFTFKISKMTVEDELNIKIVIYELKSLKASDEYPGASQKASMRKTIKVLSGCKSHWQRVILRPKFWWTH